jgi:predicted enzyme related to lactoylglutathione lyase
MTEPDFDARGVGAHTRPRPVVHLELHTRNRRAATEFYGNLLSWGPECIDTRHGRYHCLRLGKGIGGGIVECPVERALWLPYVQVDRIEVATDEARTLGASVLLGPSEGPAGWRSVISTDDGAHIALWQPKEWQ